MFSGDWTAHWCLENKIANNIFAVREYFEILCAPKGARRVIFDRHSNSTPPLRVGKYFPIFLFQGIYNKTTKPSGGAFKIKTQDICHQPP